MPNHILQMTIGESENIKVEYIFMYFLFDSSLLKTMYLYILIFILTLFQQIWFEAIFVQHQMDATIW